MEIIELASDSDRAIDDVAQLLVEAFPQSYAPFPVAREEVLESFATGRLSRVAVDDDGRILGWIGAIREYDGQAWELHPLVVHSEFRGRGIGRALVEDITQLVASRGAMTLYLGTDDDQDETTLSGADLYPDVLGNLSRIRSVRGHPYTFYERLGFSVVGVIPDANGFGKPDILMAKRVREA